jgi:alanyl-tRNA synthetase
MTAQRERARATRSFTGREEDGADPTFSGLKETEFVGYEALSSEGQVLKLASSEGAVDVIEEGEEGRLVVETTPFYAESGGQVGDRGEIRTPTGLFQVTDVQKGPSGLTVHHGRVVSGDVQKAQSASLSVDKEHRVGVTQAHSGTHLLHWALRQVLGEHAHQQGSLVEPGRLRFDFSHYEAPSETEIAAIEEEINTKVLVDDSVLAFETSFDTAMEMGAMALFGEKYGDYVRVVQIGDFSRELCGGTHVRHTGQIGVLKITSEGSVAAGTRRVEVLTGMKGLLYLNQQEARLKELSALLKTDPDAAVERLERLQESMAEMERLINQQRRSRINKLGASLAEGDSLIETSGGKIATELLDETSVEDMREIANLARKKIGSGVVIIGSTNQGNANIVIAITQDLVDRGVSAKELIVDAAKLIGGGGGGQDGLAIAGGKSGSQLKAALELAQGTAKNALER